MKTTSMNILLIIPGNNTTMEIELMEWLPEKSKSTILRVPRGAGLLTSDTISDYIETTLKLCENYRDTSFDAVAYGCTAAGFILGPDGDKDVSKRIEDTIGKPVVTTARSMITSLEEVNAKSIALLTPYLDDVNIRLKSFLNSANINVSHFDSFYASDVHELAKITSSQVEEKSKKLLENNVDALFIACSQLPTKSILGKLSKEFNKTVYSSIQATAMRLINLHH